MEPDSGQGRWARRPVRFSWIIPELLAVGPEPRNYHDLRDAGPFSAVLSLQEEDESPDPIHLPEGLEWYRVPIKDGAFGGVPTVDQIAESVATLERLLPEKPTLVHCFAGVGRSPCVCAAYIARKTRTNLEDALALVARAHPPTDPTPEQIHITREYLEREGI